MNILNLLNKNLKQATSSSTRTIDSSALCATVVLRRVQASSKTSMRAWRNKSQAMSNHLPREVDGNNISALLSKTIQSISKPLFLLQTKGLILRALGTLTCRSMAVWVKWTHQCDFRDAYKDYSVNWFQPEEPLPASVSEASNPLLLCQTNFCILRSKRHPETAAGLNMPPPHAGK